MAQKVVDQYYKEFKQRFREYLIFKNTRKKKKHFLEWKEFELENTNPIFFLSTGRSGTKFFSKLIQFDQSAYATHFPEPTFMGENVAAYNLYSKSSIINHDLNYALSQSFILAREKILYQCFLHKKRYVETNNNLTFYAPALKKLFPKAKFVFLHRHPAEFVRSGLNRNWYTKINKYDIGRISPIYSMKIEWDKYSSFQKISWLWAETNKFILNFLETVPENDIFTLNFSELNTKSVHELIQFLELEINKTKIEKLINKPVNKNKSNEYGDFSNWPESEQENLINICNDIAVKLGHQL